jgi:hypothetical protein
MTSQYELPDSQEDKKIKPEVFNISKEEGRYKLTRRDFVKIASVTTGAVALTSCKLSDGVTRIVKNVISDPTSTPTITPTSTPTSTPTATSTPTPQPVMAGIAYDDTSLMSGPSWEYQFIGLLYTGMQVRIIALDDSGEWYKVIVPLEYLPELEGAPITQNGSVSEISGWIESYSVDITQGYIEDLPGEDAPPVPTSLPDEDPTGDDGISYEYTDQYGQIYNYSLPCGSQMPEGAVCTCNCVSLCSCDNYVAPCSCDSYSSGGSTCTCNSVSYWYPN